jgi:hypothetical protein
VQSLPIERAAQAQLAAAAAGAGGEATFEADAVRERVAFRGRFHLSPHDTVLHAFACSTERVLQYDGQLYVSQRCMCFYAKIFGSEHAVKYTYSSIVDLRVEVVMNDVACRLVVCVVRMLVDT